MKEKETLLLIDAHSLIHRCYHALPPFMSREGEPTGALYGLANILFKIIREKKPTYAAAFFDRPEATKRAQVYSEYKAQRKQADDELISQLIRAREVFEAFGVKVFELPGYEADDLIGTAAEKFGDREKETIILTGDLDATQLVSDKKKIMVESFKKGISDLIIYNEDRVRERFGVGPELITDYKGLVGDSSDNIKGVPGVGPKTAVGLLEEYGQIENIFKNLDEADKKFKKLIGQKEAALESKKLATIDRGVPINLPKIEEIKMMELEEDRLRELFEKMNFNSLLKRLGSNFKEDNNSRGDKKVLKNIEAEPLSSEVVYVTEEGETGEYSSKKLKVGFGLKQKVREKDLNGPYFDLGVAAWLLDSDVGNYEPDYVGRRFLKQEWGGAREDVNKVWRYMERELKKNKLDQIMSQIEMPLLPVLAEMEAAGVLLDKKSLTKLNQRSREEVRELEAKIHQAAGVVFNLNSPKQMAEVLFDRLKINKSKVKKTAGGSISTSHDNLVKIKEEHKIVPLILEYREKFKILSTYIEPIGELTDEEGRLHTTYLQTGTGTGRLSSEQPNLQNIPHGEGLAEDLRKVFVPEKGRIFLSFDYSQMELRILASVSRDKKMLAAFDEGQDIHAATASFVFNKPMAEITAHERRVAKVLNFGIVYGMGATAFAESAGLTRAEAKKFIEEYFNDFSSIKKWQDNLIRQARELGYVTTLAGRRRLVPEIQSESPRFRAQGERVAINLPIQGLGADIMKLAMIKVAKEIETRKWKEEIRMLLTTHDDLLFEAKEKNWQEKVAVIKKTMEGAFPLSVELKVEVKKGRNWGEIEKI